VLLLAGSFFAIRSGLLQSAYWLVFSYLVIGLCGLLLVLQSAPGRER
jgi:hypothetical protein